MKLSDAERVAALDSLPDWTMVRGGSAIEREFRFADFNEAFGFMSRVALRAEKLDHHPEWCNIYSRVNVVLSTHDDEGLTTKDIDLAGFMDKVFASRPE